jgi:predicted amidohydrolase/uncharacterized HAD superfamily protein
MSSIKFGEVLVSLEFILHFLPSRVLNVGSPQECLVKMDEFFESVHFNERLFPVTDAFRILNQLKNDYELHIVTARLTRLEEVTKRWINTHFPNIFHEIHFGNHYSTSGKSRSKSQMCKEIGAKLLIDDSLVYAQQCIKEGIKVILFGDYPWNRVIDVNYNRNLVGEAESSAIDALKTDHTNSHIQYAGEIVIADFEGELLSVPDKPSDKIVYRVKSWEMVEQGIYKMLPLEHNNVKSENILSERNEFLHVCVIQMCSVNDKQANLTLIKKLIIDANEEIGFSKVKEGIVEETHLVCLPENCLFIGTTREETLQQAELLEESESLRVLSEIAKEYHIWLSVGGFHERNVQIPNKMFNSHFIINPDGNIEQSSVYHKLHLFDCPLVGLQESHLSGKIFVNFVSLFVIILFFLESGNEIKSISINGWNIGLTICYDIRFPRLYQKLREERNIDIVLIPSAFTVPTGQAHWEILLRARAIENQIYVVAAAQAGQYYKSFKIISHYLLLGKHNEKRESYGYSMIVNPFGEIIKQLGDDVGICYATLSKSKIEEIRKNMPVQVMCSLSPYFSANCFP